MTRTGGALVVEDDPDLNRQLVTALQDSGYVVDSAKDGEEGHYLGDTEPYDAVVLDLGLPIIDGVSVLEKWRRAGKKMPVLILTARDRWSDKVAGFDAGADDYVAKPFHMEEVLARVRALAAAECRPCHERTDLRARIARYQERARDRQRHGGEADLARVPAAGLSDAPQGQGDFAHRTGRASL
jgi:DNA-binding response OmpR family regulator